MSSNKNLWTLGATSEYPATIVLDLTAHIFLKNEERAGINYREWPGNLKFSRTFKGFSEKKSTPMKILSLIPSFLNFWLLQPLFFK